MRGPSLLLAAAVSCAPLAARAGEPEEWPPPHQLKPDAESSLAFSALVRRVVERPTVRSLVGPSETPLPLDLANFLLDRPDLAAYIVKKRGIAPYRIEMLGPRRSSADDGDGTSGIVNLVSREETARLYYGEGAHNGALFPTLRANAVIALTLEPRQGPDCRRYTRTSFRVYVRLKSRVVSGLVKLLRPFVRDTVVRKFTKAFLVADQVGRLMQQDPAGVSEDALAYGGLSAADRASLAALLAGLARPPACPKRSGAPGEFH
ncbi:MAG: hypothetical protein SF051_09160 [Elusimicrobiota bacterium]|nr:hypothetical protein [Elusimicrobiota bacterium]